MNTTGLRVSDLRFLLGVLLPALTLHSVSTWPHLAGFVGLAVLCLVAGLEALVPALARSPAPLREGASLRWVLRLFVPVELAVLVAGASAAMQGGWGIVLSAAIAVGFVTGGQGITFAHELGHSRHRGDRALAWLLMTLVGYPQFMVEHFRGHHVHAATRDDPASARPGESFWAFLPRTLAGSLRSAWQLEARQLQRLQRRWLRSPLAWATLAVVGWVTVLAALGAWKLLAFWAVQSALAIWLLEAVNYVEHYGLQRRIQPDGRPEPFGVQHAWNADHVISNSLLANLQRHSDHHVNAWKPFAQLAPGPGPQLPTGYAGCILLAAVPPLWFAVMEPRRASAAPAG
jgi:alkane 1-monooxygenase